MKLSKAVLLWLPLLCLPVVTIADDEDRAEDNIIIKGQLVDEPYDWISLKTVWGRPNPQKILHNLLIKYTVDWQRHAALIEKLKEILAALNKSLDAYAAHYCDSAQNENLAQVFVEIQQHFGVIKSAVNDANTAPNAPVLFLNALQIDMDNIEELVTALDAARGIDHINGALAERVRYRTMPTQTEGAVTIQEINTLENEEDYLSGTQLKLKQIYDNICEDNPYICELRWLNSANIKRLIYGMTQYSRLAEVDIKKALQWYNPENPDKDEVHCALIEADLLLIYNEIRERNRDIDHEVCRSLACWMQQIYAGAEYRDLREVAADEAALWGIFWQLELNENEDEHSEEGSEAFMIDFEGDEGKDAPLDSILIAQAFNNNVIDNRDYNTETGQWDWLIVDNELDLIYVNDGPRNQWVYDDGLFPHWDGLEYPASMRGYVPEHILSERNETDAPSAWFLDDLNTRDAMTALRGADHDENLYLRQLSNW